MIETQVPKDIMKFKTTLVGPFTKRQTICGLVSLGVDYILMSIISKLNFAISLDLRIGVCVFGALPIMAFAILEPYGMPLEKYLKNAFILGYIAPKYRPFETENVFTRQPEEKKIKERNFSAAELKKHPDYIRYE